MELLQPTQANILNYLRQSPPVVPSLTALAISQAWPPIDLQSATNGAWRAFGTNSRCTFVFHKTAGTAGDDPLLHVQQATDDSGTGAKDLEITVYWKKQSGNLYIDPAAFTKVTQSASADIQLDATSAESQMIVLVEVDLSDLDTAGGFNSLRFQCGSVGANPQLGSALYLFSDPAEPLLDITACRIGLYTNNVGDNSPTLALVDFEEPTFTGYSRKSFLAWLMGTRADGNKYLAAGSVQWQATALPTGNQPLFGALLIDSVADELISYWPFASQLLVDHIGQIVEVSPEFGLNDQSPQDLIPSTS